MVPAALLEGSGFGATSPLPAHSMTLGRCPNFSEPQCPSITTWERHSGLLWGLIKPIVWDRAGAPLGLGLPTSETAMCSPLVSAGVQRGGLQEVPG